MGDPMNDDHSRNHPKPNDHESKPLKFLGRSQIEMIDEALEAIGPFGEVQLIVDKRRLWFVVTKNSYDALNWHPDSVSRQEANHPPTEKPPKTSG